MDSGVHMTGPVVTWQNPVVIPHHCLCVCQSHRVIKKDDINGVLLLQSLRMESKDFWILFPHGLHHGQMSAVVTGNSSFSDTVSFRDRCCAISLGSVYKAAGTRWRQGRESSTSQRNQQHGSSCDWGTTSDRHLLCSPSALIFGSPSCWTLVACSSFQPGRKHRTTGHHHRR